MSGSQVITDPQAVADQYRTAVEAGDLEALTDLYHPDALLDAHVPNWRFQAQGPQAIVQNTGGLPGPGRFTSLTAEPTASGDLLLQFEWRQDDDEGGAKVRELHLLRLVDGRIAEQILYCAGVWDPQLQARMTEEAPLIRP